MEDVGKTYKEYMFLRTFVYESQCILHNDSKKRVTLSPVR